jgi:hypothetical protein
MSVVGLMRFNYVRSMTFQSTTKFLLGSRWVLGSLLFVAAKFRDLSVQEPELLEITGLVTGRFPSALVRVGLINEARLGHRSMVLGEVDSDPSGDKADHNLAEFPATTDPIDQLPPKITRATWLAKEANRGKRHNDLQDDFGSSDDEPRDDAPSRRHHPKFNS